MTPNQDEGIRAFLQHAVNSDPRERAQIEAVYGVGNVWDTGGLTRDFIVHGFAAPFCIVTRQRDQKRGAVVFQHNPRYYFGFEVDV